MERFFHIEDVGNDRLLVIILSTELTSVYWNELLNAFQRNHWRNRTVYFDFIYRNGFENRFFSAVLNDESRLMGRLHRCEIESTFDRMSRLFFAKNIELLEDSILSSIQIERLIGTI